jgi:PTS system mannose-specific IIA component
MTGIIIITHGPFGAEMLAACGRMLGPQPKCAAVALEEGMGGQDLAALIEARLGEFGPSLLMVDMLGGTPWNASLLRGLPAGCEVLAGLSLPLLIEALSLRGSLDPLGLGRELKARASSTVATASALMKDGRP